MARATIDDLVVNFEDGQYRCRLKRVPARRWAELQTALFKALLPEHGADGFQVETDAVVEMVDECIASVDCDGEDVAVADLDISEVSAICAALRNFTQERMRPTTTPSGDDSQSNSEPSGE